MNRTLLLLLGGGALLYWWYSSSATAAPVTTTPATGGTNPPTGTTTSTSPSQLATIFQQLVANAQVGTTGKLTPYQWNYSLGIVAPSITPPDPAVVFGSADAASVPMVAGDYWAVMSPYLHTNLGLSGLGGWLA